MTTTQKRIQDDGILQTMVVRLCKLDAVGQEAIVEYDEVCDAISGRLDLLGAHPEFEGFHESSNRLTGIVVEADGEDVYVWAE